MINCRITKRWIYITTTTENGNEKFCRDKTFQTKQRRVSKRERRDEGEGDPGEFLKNIYQKEFI